MNSRPFGWRDFLLLQSYRNRGIFLDSSRALIHGQTSISAGAFFPLLGLPTRAYTYRCSSGSQDGTPIIGQVTYTPGAPNARLSYLAPEDAMEMQDLSTFTEYIAVQVGEMGAFHILAEVDESSPVYHLLRRSGFAIYARQRIWRLDGEARGEEEAAAWKPCKSTDIIGARSLYCNIVPGLVQQVEPLSKKRLNGFVHYQQSDLRAYIELKYGRYGIWVQPYVHPDTEGFGPQLVSLLRNLPRRYEKPLYLCIRSYQSWLESSVELLGAQPGPRQAVMVRHLTLSQRVKQTYPIPAMNGTHAEPTAPIAHFDESHLREPSEGDQFPGAGSVS